MPTGRIIGFDCRTGRGRLVCRERAREYPFAVSGLDDADRLDAGIDVHFQVLTSDEDGAAAVCLRPVA